VHIKKKKHIHSVITTLFPCLFNSITFVVH